MSDKYQQLSSISFVAFFFFLLYLFVLGEPLFPDLLAGIFTKENENENESKKIIY